MSIRPPSDLVLDVVRAADPARAAAATARLARAEAQAAPATAMPTTKAAFETALRVAAPPRAGSAAGADKSAAVGKGLEEMLMRQLLQDALLGDFQLAPELCLALLDFSGNMSFIE